jgi:hypothetical protein
MSPIGILWSLLSVMVAGTCSFAFMQPYWFINKSTLNCLGMYSYCLKDIRYTNSRQLCGIFGGSFDFGKLPSSSWQAACALFGGGCAFFCFAGLLSLLTLCIPKPFNKNLAVWTGYIQILAGMY